MEKKDFSDKLSVVYEFTHYCAFHEKSPSKLVLLLLDYSIQLNNTAAPCFRRSMTVWIFNMYENQ